jgi:CTP synthase (UTP-ammonia lyase)
MRPSLRIGFIGDFSPAVRAHVAIPKALMAAAQELECDLIPVWLHTSSLSTGVEDVLHSYDALWCIPGSPYANMDGALRAIRFARENRCPFLGTCGGFQHAVIEYARNVLGHSQADHAESNPAAAMPMITPLSCSLAGVRGKIQLNQGSRIAQIYGESEILEDYHCNYGINSKFQGLLNGSGLQITGEDELGAPRVIELQQHRFFIATLFQPELGALSGRVSPLITALLDAALKCRVESGSPAL